MSAVLYGLLWVLFNVLGRLFFRYRVVGREHIPRRGGVLIAANHASYLDIPLLGCGIPRRVAFLGRQDLFPIPGVRETLRWLGWIPIRQDRLDREGFGQAIRLIKAGKVVVIFPEGMRSPDGRLRPGKPGIGVIVAETGCPVVPAYIAGTHEALPVGARWIKCHPVRITYGKPLDFTADAARGTGKEFYRHVGRVVVERIAELGHVAPPADPSEGPRRGRTSPPTEPHNAE
ncbi:lysophospholipid acyltransferase family protein [Nitrospira sp. Kam-Ns4a]